MIRNLSIDGIAYGWQVTHRHLVGSSMPGVPGCVDEFMAFRRGRSAPLRIVFASATPAGPVSAHGVCASAAGTTVHLHRPRTAEILIRHAMATGWQAQASRVIEDGFAFVESLPVELKQRLQEVPAG